jgi:hypothetical protein
VRYLPRGVPVGDRRVSSLTIGTYPQRRALETLRATAARSHVPTMRLGNGGLAFVDKKHPMSVYLAYPNVDLQLEVYDPAPGRAAARRFRSDRIRALARKGARAGAPSFLYSVEALLSCRRR